VKRAIVVHSRREIAIVGLGQHRLRDLVEVEDVERVRRIGDGLVRWKREERTSREVTQETPPRVHFLNTALNT
jgi:hypothetical protein